MNKEYIESLSEDELFVIISSENIEEKKYAFEVFYKQKSKLLWSICNKVCNNQSVFGENLSSIVFQNTMMKIYKHPKYDKSKGKLSTWMSRIAQNEMYNYISENKPSIYLEDNLNINPICNEEDHKEKISYEEKILEEALSILSEKERHILLIYFSYKDGNKHLPDNVMNELISIYSTTSQNIRQIKKRSLEKVKSFIDSNYNVQTSKNKKYE